MSGLLMNQFYSNRLDFIIVSPVLLFTLFFRDNPADPFTPIIFSVAMTWLFSIGIDMKEYKNNTDVLLNSLPVTRRQIVTTKYMTSLLVGFIFIIVGNVTWFLTKGHSLVSLSDALLVISAVALFAAIYYPLYYKFGARFVTIALVMLMISFTTIFPIAFHLGLRHGFWGLADVWEQHPAFVLTALCTIAVVAMLVSRSISIRLYEKKEF